MNLRKDKTNFGVIGKQVVEQFRAPPSNWEGKHVSCMYVAPLQESVTSLVK